VTQDEAQKEFARREALKAAVSSHAKPEKAIPPAFPTAPKPADAGKSTERSRSREFPVLLVVRWSLWLVVVVGPLPVRTPLVRSFKFKTYGVCRQVLEE